MLGWLLEWIDYYKVFSYLIFLISERWLEFAVKQKKLKILIIDILLSLEHLQRLTLIIKKISTLVVIKIYWKWDYGYHEIANIMGTQPKLRKVALSDMSKEMCKELKNSSLKLKPLRILICKIDWYQFNFPSNSHQSVTETFRNEEITFFNCVTVPTPTQYFSSNHTLKFQFYLLLLSPNK